MAAYEALAWTHGVGGGGGGYTTGAVNFDGATYQTNAAVAIPDSPYLSASIWYYLPTFRIEALDFFDFDPANTECPEIGFQTSVAGGPTLVENDVVFIASNAHNVSWKWRVTTNPLMFYGGWCNLLYSVDCNHTQNNKTCQAYFNDVDINTLSSSTLFNDGSAGALTMLMNGLSLGIPDTPADDTPLTGYLADYWIGAGQLIDFSVMANRRKFISASGKPVNLGADGSIPTGTAPAVFLRRAPSGAAATFANNLGTGGDFTITGSLTNSPSSPSD